MYTYEIDENNTIRFYKDPPLDPENPNEPILIVTSWQNGDAFIDKSDAEVWAKTMLDTLTDVTPNLIPGWSRDTNPQEQKLSPQEMEIEE